jgi:hypothetical protein
MGAFAKIGGENGVTPMSEDPQHSVQAPAVAGEPSTHPDTLLAQYYKDLEVSFLTAKQSGGEAPAEITERIDGLLRRDPEWRTAYEIEQYLTYLYDDATLDQQLERRFVDLEKHGDPARYDRSIKLKEGLETRRAKQELLLDITRNVQWAYGTRIEFRRYIGILRSKTLYVFAFALIVFVALLVVSHTEFLFDYDIYDFNTRTFVIGIGAGFLGSTFSILLRLRTELVGSRGDVKSYSSYLSIILRPAIGVCAALILFFLIQSDLLGGSLFPELPIERKEGEVLLDHYGTISKMIVWGVIAGFSEYFVPNLLKRTESEVA